MKKIFGLMLAAATLSACGTNDTAAFNQELDQRNQEIAVLRRSYRQEIQDPSLDLIRDKVTLNESYLRHASPCDGGIDNSYPSPAERVVINRWMSERSDFLTRLAALTAPVPSESERYTRMMTNFDKNKFFYAAQISEKINELAEGRLTYCQFAEASRNINIEARRNAMAFRAELETEGSLDFKRRAGGSTPTIRLYGGDTVDDLR